MTAGGGHEEKNGVPLPAELTKPATATAGGHAEENTEDGSAVSAKESPAARDLPTQTLEEGSFALRSDGSEVFPPLEEPLEEPLQLTSGASSRPASADKSEIDGAPEAGAELAPWEVNASVEDADATTPPAVAGKAPKAEGADVVVSPVKYADVSRVRVEVSLPSFFFDEGQLM